MTGENVVQEFKRKQRVSDMLVTAHNILGTRYRKVSITFDIALMLASFSILLLSVVDLAGPTVITNVFGSWVELGIAVCATVIFVLSVIEWRISLKSKSEAHFQAARNFSSIKSEINALLAKGIQDEDVSAAKIEDRYEKLALSCIQIPHDKFVKLKRMHVKKVTLSKLLDEQSFAIPLIIRLRLAIRDTVKGWSEID